MRKLSGFIAGAALIAAASAYRGFFDLFSYFAQYDDTGFMLSLIQGFNERAGLYRETFSQYGPFYSEFYLFVDRILHAPITHDGIRWITLVLWIGSSFAGSIIAYRFTRRIWPALLVQALSFQMLNGLVEEPGHPIGLVAALLAGLALAANCFGAKNAFRRQAVLVGALLGALTMTKINLGLFAVASVGTAWVFCFRPDGFGRLLRYVAALVFSLGGVFLVKPVWLIETRCVFITLFIGALLSVLVVARPVSLSWPVLQRFGAWALGAFCLTVMLSLSGVLLTGTRVVDLIRGLLLQPMALGTVYISLPDLPREVAYIAASSLVAACGWRLLISSSSVLSQWIGSGLRLLFVGLVTGWVIGVFSPWIVLAFLWIAALPLTSAHAIENGTSFTDFGRLVLVLLPVGQLLGIYPVSGAQVTIPNYLAVLSLVPVLQGLIASDALERLRRWPAARFVLPFVVLAPTSCVLARQWSEQVRTLTSEYGRRASLDLPGAKLLRLGRLDAASCRCIAANLRNSRPTFLSVPGLNSLYGWAQRPFPTGFNTTVNFALLSDEEQRAMVAVGRTCRPIALVVNEYLVNLWVQGRFQPSGPLVDFVRDECSPVGRVRGYDLMSLKGEPMPALTYCAVISQGSSFAEHSQITVTLPAQFPRISKAFLLDLSGSSSPTTVIPLEELARARSQIDQPEELEVLSFRNPYPAGLTLESLNSFLVQLYGENGEPLTELPFARLAEGR